MQTNLSQLRLILVTRKGIVITATFILLLVAIIVFFASKSPTITSLDIPPSVDEQPVKQGIFDKEATSSQTSKGQIEDIKSKLPHRKEFKTSTGTNVTYTIFYKPTDPFSLYVETTNIRFATAPTDPMLPKSVQDFRDTAEEILKWLKKSGLDTSNVFIIWGDSSLTQKTAESWLNISQQFPNVIKNGNAWQFETEPTK